MNLVRLIKMCLPETSSRFWVGKNLSDLCSIRNGLKNGDSLLLFTFIYAEDYAISRIQVSEVDF